MVWISTAPGTKAVALLVLVARMHLQILGWHLATLRIFGNRAEREVAVRKRLDGTVSANRPASTGYYRDLATSEAAREFTIKRSV